MTNEDYYEEYLISIDFDDRDIEYIYNSIALTVEQLN